MDRLRALFISNLFGLLEGYRSLSVGETSLLFESLSAVWLDVGSLAASSSEVLFGFSVSVTSEQNSVSAYYI